MYYIIHVATAFKSLKLQSREIQELIWTRTQSNCRKKDPAHPILSTTLDQYLTRETSEIFSITAALKKKMALTPEFGHVVAIAKALAENNSASKVKVEIAQTAGDEKELLQKFWQKLGAFTKKQGIPTFVTWNGLEFTFPFLIERSTALGVEPSCVLPRARFQPWKHLDLLAELADYDPHRYMSLQSRLTLWGLKLNGNGKGNQLADHELLIEQWRKENSKPLEENLTHTVEAIHQLLKRTAPYLLETRHSGQ